jgi:hypothetical protein
MNKSRCQEIQHVPWARLIVLGFLALATIGSLFTMAAGGSAEGFLGEGTVDIATGHNTRLLALGTMAPGDVVTGTSTVENRGTLGLRYGMVSNTTEDTLAAQLTLTVKVGVNDCTDTGIDSSGTVLYGPARLGSMEGTDIFGDPAQTGRTLASGEMEVLCLQVSLPLDTGNDYQGLETTATLTFWAEQSAAQ